MSEHTIGLSRRTFLTGAAALGALSVLAPTTAFAETAAEKQAEADAVRNQLIGLQADLEAAVQVPAPAAEAVRPAAAVAAVL